MGLRSGSTNRPGGLQGPGSFRQAQAIRGVGDGNSPKPAGLSHQRSAGEAGQPPDLGSPRTGSLGMDAAVLPLFAGRIDGLGLAGPFEGRQ